MANWKIVQAKNLVVVLSFFPASTKYLEVSRIVIFFFKINEHYNKPNCIMVKQIEAYFEGYENYHFE